MQAKSDNKFNSKNIEDCKTIIAIELAFSGVHGEMSSLMQYLRCFFIFKSRKENEIADILLNIIKNQIEQLKVITKLLDELNINPIFLDYPKIRWDFYSEKNYTCSTTRKILLDCIANEKANIKEFEKIKSNTENLILQSVVSNIVFEKKARLEVMNKQLDRTKKGE